MVFTPTGQRVPAHKRVRDGFHAYMKDVFLQRDLKRRGEIRGERGRETPDNRSWKRRGRLHVCVCEYRYTCYIFYVEGFTAASELT